MNEFTASIISSPKAVGKLIIPKYVEYDSKQFLITSIESFAFHRNEMIESLIFSPDSSLKRIFSNAFIDSSINEIKLPASLEILDDQWCIGAGCLNKLSVDSRNPHYVYVDDTFLIHKKEGKIDNLIFIRRNVAGNIKIPNGVTSISGTACFQCNCLKSVSFGNSSSLKSIERFAFAEFENLELIESIPRSVVSLRDESFENLPKISSLELLSDEISIDSLCFWWCRSLFLVSFPNVKNIKISKEALNGVCDAFSMFVKCGAQINIY